MLEESVKEVVGREPKFPLEEGGEHHDFLGIGCWNVLPYGRPPLKHGTIREKVILD
jgi:hypothetical protein